MSELYAVQDTQHPLLDQLKAGNLIEDLEDKDAQRVLGSYGDAKLSMADWLRQYKEALWLAKLQPYAGGSTIKQKDFPFENSSMAMLPFIMEAMLDFSSRAAPELVWSRDVIKVKVYGDDEVAEPSGPAQMPGMPQAPATDEQQAIVKNRRAAKLERAVRVATYSNYQIQEEMSDWREEQDKMLLSIPCVGTAFKESYFDPDEQRVCSDLYYANEIIFDHNYKSFDKAPDKFIELKLTRNEVIAFVRGEQLWDLDEDKLDKDQEEFEFIKAYTWVDLDDDGIREPYIMIIDATTSQAVYLEPNYDDDTLTLNKNGDLVKIKANQRFTQYKFLPDPEGGPMGMGWGILLGVTFAALNTNLRQMIDAATLQTAAANSGIVELDTTTGRGNSMAEGPVDIKLGQLTPVTTRGNRPLRDSIFQFPANGPSDSLMKLVEFLTDALRRMTSASSHIDANPNEAASLYLARLNQALKVPNSIIMRVYDASATEFKVIAKLNYKYHSDKLYNRVLDNDTQANMRNDFNPKDCDIGLTADPSQGSDNERIARAESILQEAKTQPTQVLNTREAYINWLKSIGAPNIQELAPIPGPDPMQEMMLKRQQADMELEQRDRKLREGELRVKEMNAAAAAAEARVKLGFAEDETAAKLIKLHSESLKNLVDIGLSVEQSLDLMQGEERYLE